MRKKSKSRLFDKAYKKASLMQPGDQNPLTENENRELLRQLYPFPEKYVKCQICGRETKDINRPELHEGVRVCGSCLCGKSPSEAKKT